LKHKTLNIEQIMIVEQMLKNAPKPLLHIADVSGSALFNADCMDILSLIPDKSVQLILADLPYGTTACKWDSVLDLNELWVEYERIITDSGAIVLTASEPFTSILVCSNLKLFRYKWVWDKVNRYTGYANANKMPLKRHEDILVFYKKLPTYNKQMIDGKPYKYTRKKNKEEHLGKNGLTDRIGGSIDGKRNPFDIISITADNKKENGLHPTQKPLELMKYLILTYSNDGDLVLDNTMGVGTTCLGAKELNRSFIGIEKEVKYYDLAVARVFG
jgi:site-specific DNA-methyltransferase (adenine-specific)